MILNRFALAAALVAICGRAALATTFVVEAESLELTGGWDLHANARSDTSRAYLAAMPEAVKAPAVGAIELPHGGAWRLWVRSKDFPKDRPGTRRFSVRIGEAKSAVKFGAHGQEPLEGWAWEDGGTLELKAGANLVVLGDEVQSTARCDALVLTDNMTYRPEGVPWKLAKEAAVKAKLTMDTAGRRAICPAPLLNAPPGKTVELRNARLALRFSEMQTEEGPAIAISASDPADHKHSYPLEMQAESYDVLFRPEEKPPKIDAVKVYPTWDAAMRPTGTMSAGGVSATTRLGTETTPWTAGRCLAMRPSGAQQVDAQTVELSFPATEDGELRARWTLKPEVTIAEVALTFTPKVSGHFSLGYRAPVARPVDVTDFLLLPFMLQGHRLQEHPAAMLSSSMPTPVALVAVPGLTCAVMAEPRDLPIEWPSNLNARYALGLRNEAGDAQPFIYGPVLGEPGSPSQGEPITMRFRVLLQNTHWYEAYRVVADGVFGLRDYREPTQASLSDTALNLLDFVRDEKASGWDARAKGPWNIESRNTVSHCAPLTYLSYYLLTGDRAVYEKLARPAVEYLFSRPGPHFAAEREIWDNYYHHQPMRGPGGIFGAHWFAALQAMTQGQTRAAGEYLLRPDGTPRVSPAHGHAQPFEEALALYWLTGERSWLERAMADADRYIEANLKKLPERDLGSAPFVNVSFVPDWEGLLHLYEASREPRFLEASVEGARWLLTTLWTQPHTPTGETTINPGGVYNAQRHLWWWGDRLYRRGIIDIPATDAPPYPPAPALPERKVPAWTVSNVGLGLEQPSTFNRNGPRANILMSNWAPNLLRLAKATGDEAFRTAARNAMIGRFGNYPGYYLDGPTDIYHRPDYPVVGPDVTSLYVHHAPAFAASVLDYLFTDAEMRSGGVIVFPSVRQYGYVWFDNRLFGHAPGQVYGRRAWPWLHRTAATVDTVKVDRVLAEGDGEFHVILMNQVRAEQPVRVSFDEAVLGRKIEGAGLSLRLEKRAAEALHVEHGGVSLVLPPLGIATLTMSGVKIDVPTHRVAPQAVALAPTSGAVRRAKLPGTSLEAVGLEIAAPPFTARELYVYVTAGIDDCRASRLHYRIGEGAEQVREGTQFPWEFSQEIGKAEMAVTWWVEVQMADGRWVRSE